MLIKLDRNAYPPRHWVLAGRPWAGKSTFLTAMRGALLIIDADRRAQEIARRVAEVFVLGREREASADPLFIAKRLADEDLSGIGTVAVDSLTAIYEPLVAMAMAENKAGANRNKLAAFDEKARAVRLIQDAVTATGRDCVFVLHKLTRRDPVSAGAYEDYSLSRTERERLGRSTNAWIELGVEEGTNRRYARVIHSRFGARGAVVYDEEGDWRGVPERLEAAMYEGKTACSG